jgi:hypothetical protein
MLYVVARTATIFQGQLVGLPVGATAEIYQVLNS